MSTICLSSNYSTFSLNQLECLYDGFDSSSNGLNYYDNGDSLEDQLAKELDDLLTSYKESTTVTFTPITAITATSSDEEIYAVMNYLQCRYKYSVKQLEAIEQQNLFDIRQYNRLSMKNAGITIKACLDYIDIKFTTAKSLNRSSIKKYLTEKTGIRHFIKVVDESDVILEDKKKNDSTDRIGTTFVIRFHDVRNLKALIERLSYITHYNANLSITDLEVVRVERAIDFYRAPKEMRIALFKSIRLSEAVNCRFYNENTSVLKKNQYGVCQSTKGGMFNTFDKYQNIIDGNTIYINDRDSDHYFRIYYKTTDYNKQRLEAKDHRVRFEENYSDKALLKLNGGDIVRIRDLPIVIKKMSSALSFVRLRHESFPYFRSVYRNFVKPYGLETPVILGINGRKIKRRVNSKIRNLCKDLELHAEFNQKIRESQKELADKFKVKN